MVGQQDMKMCGSSVLSITEITKSLGKVFEYVGTYLKIPTQQGTFNTLNFLCTKFEERDAKLMEIIE